jgi:TonB-linked SusC/RagA family outer membrane protein
MRKKLSILAGMLILFVQLAVAQNVDVSGTVTDDKGAPIVGASVQERGSNRGTTTDEKGNFKLSVKRNSTIEVSSVGFDKKTSSAGSGGTLNFQLAPATNQNLTEVVVTALGIKREKKALGYAVSTVDKKQLELRPDGDAVRLLSGKVPGANILSSSGISGSGTNIQIRGLSTISGNSTPLFVVDGVPFDGSTNNQTDFTQGNQTGSRFFDLDPNNIESISVLKGLSATTLYGSLGRNGVILVTTKNGGVQRGGKKKTEITVNQSLFANQVANLPEYQNNYGGGFHRDIGFAFFSNWGSVKFTNPALQLPHPYSRAALNASFPQFIGAKVDYKAYDNVTKFFRTGLVRNTSININGGGPGAAFNANYSNLSDEGFTPGNIAKKNSFGIGGNIKLSNKVQLNATVNYVVSDFKSPPTASSTGSGADFGVSIFGDLIYTPRSADLMGWPFENPADNSSVYYRAGNDITNPRWTAKYSSVEQVVNRVFGNMQLRYEIMKGLSLSYKLGFDNYNELQAAKHNKGAAESPLGYYRTTTGNNTIWDNTFIGSYQTNLTDDISLNADAGVNSYQRVYKQTGTLSTQQLTFGLFDHTNFISQSNRNEAGGDMDYIDDRLLVGAFAQTTFGYKDFAYLNLGARNDWSSNFEKANRSQFYPNVSVSFIPTSAIEGLKSSKALNYLKIRAGYSTSAGFGDPYRTRPTLTLSPNSFVSQGGTVVNTNSVARRRPNPDLKPELSQEIELGIEGKFINNRASIDLTLYQRTNPDQILQRDLDPASGFDIQDINGPTTRNRGIELGLGYTIIRAKNLTWDVNTNFTLNRNKAYNFPEGIEQLVLAGFTNLGLVVRPDLPVGVIYGSLPVRDASKGNQLVVDGDGNYLEAPEPGIIGDPNPDFQLTGITNLAYKGFSFRMQWDYSHGGDMYAVTPLILLSRGLTKDTDFDRDLPVVLPGVKQDGTPNDIQITATGAHFRNLLQGPDQFAVWDATVIRLREMSLSYALPESVLRKTPFGGVSLTVSGQNLWYNAPNFPKYTNFDPETTTLGVGTVTRGFEQQTGPSSRRMGASLRITF